MFKIPPLNQRNSEKVKKFVVFTSYASFTNKEKMKDDELLKRFVDNNDEDAFEELVKRHVSLVHSIAIRTLGNEHDARDVTQNVFTLFAQKSSELCDKSIIIGWLYKTCRNKCHEKIREHQRHQKQDRIIVEMRDIDNVDQWKQISTELEPAMDRLTKKDRQAVLLRFYERKTLREVGIELGLSESAAQKTVSRAIHKLYAILSSRGIAFPSSCLSGVLLTNAVQGTSTGFAASIAAKSLTTYSLTIPTISSMNILLNTKVAAAVLGAAAITGTSTYLLQLNNIHELNRQNSSLSSSHAEIQLKHDSLQDQLLSRNLELDQLKKNLADLHRLRGEVTQLQSNAREIEKLKNLNQELELRLKNLANSNANTETTEGLTVEINNYISKENLKNVGYKSPESTMETSLWAGRVGKLTKYVESFSEDIQKNMPIPEDDPNGEEHASLKNATGLMLLNKKLINDEEVELVYIVFGWNENQPFSQSLTKKGDEWKISGPPMPKKS